MDKKYILTGFADEIAPELDKQIAGETVKKAVYNATRESGKNVPRSIASRKHWLFLNEQWLFYFLTFDKYYPLILGDGHIQRA